MNPILRSFLETGFLSHAYLLVGDPSLTGKMARETAGKILNFKEEELHTHPDFFYQKMESLGIKDSHEISRKASIRPFMGEKKVFIIETLSITLDSENALLKTMEEPPESTHFFVLVPSQEIIIPTLRSRFAIVEVGAPKEKKLKHEEAVNKFISASHKKRLSMAKESFEEDGIDAVEFLNELEVVMRSKNNLKAVGDIERVKKFLYNPTASHKMILEHLALVLPKM